MSLTRGSTGRTCEWQSARQYTCNDNSDLHLEPQSDRGDHSAITYELVSSLRQFVGAQGLGWYVFVERTTQRVR
jgi:hypothetical protein